MKTDECITWFRRALPALAAAAIVPLSAVADGEPKATEAAEKAPPAEVEKKDGWSFAAGADLRVRQEIMDNIPGLPGGGLLSRAPYSKVRNHIRFRPDVWAELKAGDDWRFFAKLTDEFRANITPKNHSNTFPDELIVENLFFEGKNLFDGFLDICAGRQNLYKLYGLDHIFVDGTPGDGSRTTYADMVNLALHVDDVSELDFFALYNADSNQLRWGTRRGRYKRLSGLGGGAEPEMDDWGWGAIWRSKIGTAFDYDIFAMQKNTASFHRGGVKHPRTQRNMFGFKTVPHITDNFNLQFEGMGQLGRNGEDDVLSGWSAYAGGEWRDMAKKEWQPFMRLGFHYMSGDKDAAEEDGGHRAWDPMWARGVNDSELFLYGTHYGAAWWSNMLYLKATAGYEIGKYHDIVVSTGPMFAAVQDDLGGGDGTFKGMLSMIRYDFPIYLTDKVGPRGIQVFGHVLFELFNPGDYFETDRPSWFFRWQLDVKF